MAIQWECVNVKGAQFHIGRNEAGKRVALIRVAKGVDFQYDGSKTPVHGGAYRAASSVAAAKALCERLVKPGFKTPAQRRESLTGRGLLQDRRHRGE